MGCLNSDGRFDHYFSQIHFSGPCNRDCYFCIGQHMMVLDSLNNLATWPLPGIDEFINKCNKKGIGEVHLSASNTDPLLYKHIDTLCYYLQERLTTPLVFSMHTNGVRAAKHLSWRLFDKVSISLPSFNPDVYEKMMGSRDIPDLQHILARSKGIDVKINIMLGPENTVISHDYTLISKDLCNTLDKLAHLGIQRVNLREPYGQPHVGNPLKAYTPCSHNLAMPQYNWNGMIVTYWDIHYVEVESVNLYANGIISETYPVTKGCDGDKGIVLDQTHFKKSGRVRSQWLNLVNEIEGDTDAYTKSD